MLVLGEHLAALEDVERALAIAAEGAPPPLRAPLEAALAARGKRVRARVAILCYGAAGGRKRARAVEVGVAVELLHLATLVVDDVLDGADTRRGRASVVAAHGVPLALLSGGFLLSRALRRAAPASADASSLEGIGPDEAGAALSALEDVLAAEALAAEGTPLDEAGYVEYARGKTGALFSLASEGGVRRAGRPGLAAAARAYGTHLGIAFQLADDDLDVRGDAAITGKPSGTDSRTGAPNAHRLLGAARARALAKTHAEAAIDALSEFPHSPEREALANVARDAIDRAR